MYFKVHESQKSRIVAVCDEELIGKVLQDEDIYLDLNKYRSFYVGEKGTEETVKEALKKFNSANIIGKNSVKVIIEMGLANKDEVRYIKRIPYIQLYKI